MTMPTDYPTLVSILALAGLVYKAGAELTGMRKDIHTLAETVKTLSDLPQRVASLEESRAQNKRRR